MTVRTRLVLLIVFSSLLVLAQQKQPAPQTPRQALIEMINGGEQAIKKHLTLEIQQMIHDLEQKKPGGKSTPTELRLGMMMGGGDFGLPAFGKDLKTFDTGNVFLSYKDPGEQQVVEVRVEGDDLRGDEDDLQFSIHVLQDGQEMEIPYMPNITVGMKKQEGIWRINSVGGSLKAEIGDPKFFQAISKMQHEEKASARKAATATRQEPRIQDVSTAMNMLSFAETMYAQQHPDIGFTCNLADLMNSNEGGSSQFTGMLDPQIATGTANGYRYSISGCETKPAEIFHLVAEPLAQGGGAKAYCTNATRIVRVSDDGRGSTCLASGRVPNRVPDTKSESKDHDEVELKVVK